MREVLVRSDRRGLFAMLEHSMRTGWDRTEGMSCISPQDEVGPVCAACGGRLMSRGVGDVVEHRRDLLAMRGSGERAAHGVRRVFEASTVMGSAKHETLRFFCLGNRILTDNISSFHYALALLASASCPLYASDVDSWLRLRAETWLRLDGVRGNPVPTWDAPGGGLGGVLALASFSRTTSK